MTDEPSGMLAAAGSLMSVDVGEYSDRFTLGCYVVLRDLTEAHFASVYKASKCSTCGTIDALVLDKYLLPLTVKQLDDYAIAAIAGRNAT